MSADVSGSAVQGGGVAVLDVGMGDHSLGEQAESADEMMPCGR
jgi:hypothetical protein